MARLACADGTEEFTHWWRCYSRFFAEAPKLNVILRGWRRGWWHGHGLHGWHNENALWWGEPAASRPRIHRRSMLRRPNCACEGSMTAQSAPPRSVGFRERWWNVQAVPLLQEPRAVDSHIGECVWRRLWWCGKSTVT